MRVRLDWMVFAAALCAASVAHADSVTLTLLTPTATYSASGETLTYQATVAAPGTNIADVFLNGDSLNVQSPLTADDTDFYVNFPLFLSTGDSYTGDLFTVTVPTGTSPGIYPGSFVLLGGGDPNAADTLATANFGVTVTPELSSAFLLGTGLLGVAAAMRKRFVF